MSQKSMLGAQNKMLKKKKKEKEIDSLHMELQLLCSF